jgi:hypothetical protein
MKGLRLTARGRRVVWLLESLAIAGVVWFAVSLDGLARLVFGF